MSSVAGPTVAPSPAEAVRPNPAASTTPPEPAFGNQALLRRLQAKLVVGAVDDPLEREADAVASQVMRMPDRDVVVSSAPPQISRKCGACENEEKLQAKGAATEMDGQEAPALVSDALQTPGQPLDAGLRSFFEPRFGRDFSDVRVHHDTRAARSAHEVGARAYTVGRDLVFAPGAYAPTEASGRELIAHELTHVVQQNSGRIGGTATLRRDAAADPASVPPAVPGNQDATPASTPDPAPQQATDPAAGSGDPAAAASGTGSACTDGTVDQTQDPLPAVPAFAPQQMPGPAVFAAVQKADPTITFHPLGASRPIFDAAGASGVTVTIAPDTGNSCQKCIADWALPVPTWESLISTDFVVSDEPKRFPVTRQGDTSGCPPSAIPSLTEVRIQIPQPLVGQITAGENEHYEDFKRAYQMTGGRYLANVKRLTLERTHLRGKDQAECEAKVGDFLASAAGGATALMRGMAPLANLKPADIQQFILHQYGATLFIGESFKDVYAQSGAARDKPGGSHHATGLAPPLSQTPILPNIDTSVNPYGCAAYARRYNAQSLPGIPGDDAKTVIKDLNDPAKQPWHTL